MIIHNFRPGSVGGAELQAEHLATSLARIGHEMQVITRQAASDAPQEELRDGLIIHRVPFQLPYWIRRDNAKTFRFLVQRRRTYDILHVHMAFNHAVVAVVASRFLGKKCIIKIACTGEYGDLYQFSQFRWFAWALRILKQADAMVAISREVERELLHFGFPSDIIVRIPNGVDTARFTANRDCQHSGRVRFILTGRRHPQKGTDIAIKAAQILKRSQLHDRFSIDMYGSDYPEHDYRRMSEELGVADTVNFFPFQEDIYAVYNSAHCFLLPSRGEGLSNSLLEAMAMELPAIATRVSGVPDVIDDGENGILVQPEAPDKLAEAMSSIILNPGFAGKLGQNAREKVIAGFSLPAVAGRYSDLYQRLYNR